MDFHSALLALCAGKLPNASESQYKCQLYRFGGLIVVILKEVANKEEKRDWWNETI